jgi:hypothetical protein
MCLTSCWILALILPCRLLPQGNRTQVTGHKSTHCNWWLEWFSWRQVQPASEQSIIQGKFCKDCSWVYWKVWLRWTWSWLGISQMLAGKSMIFPMSVSILLPR